MEGSGETRVGGGGGSTRVRFPFFPRVGGASAPRLLLLLLLLFVLVLFFRRRRRRMEGVEEVLSLMEQEESSPRRRCRRPLFRVLFVSPFFFFCFPVAVIGDGVFGSPSAVGTRRAGRPRPRFSGRKTCGGGGEEEAVAAMEGGAFVWGVRVFFEVVLLSFRVFLRLLLLLLLLLLLSDSFCRFLLFFSFPAAPKEEEEDVERAVTLVVSQVRSQAYNRRVS